MVDVVEKEWKALSEDFRSAQQAYSAYTEAVKQLTRTTENSLKAIKHQNKELSVIRDILNKLQKDKNLSDDEKARLEAIQRAWAERKARVTRMQSELPVTDNGVYLSVILGSNLNVSLPSADHKFKYKGEYENFKMTVNLLFLGVLFLAYIFPSRVLDSLANFLMVWYFCTLTIRESILRCNGSRIKGWFFAHHFVATVLGGVTLTWRDGECYQAFRPLFLLFCAYIAGVQLLQNRYQVGCLRRLHALGQGDTMDITVEGFSSWMFKGLTFLLPFLMLGYLFQLHCAWTLWQLECEGDWQPIALSGLFLFVALCNIWTTAAVIIKKIRTSGTHYNMFNIRHKYSSKSDD